jgi:hypothetical protein
MTNRTFLRIGLTWIAGFLSFAVLGRCLFWATRIDLRVNPVISILFCVLPILSFPVFLAGFLFRKAAVLQPILAVAFLAAYAFLNWRTCSSLGYCGSVPSIVWMTLTTPASITFFTVALTSVAALSLDERGQSHADARTVIPSTSAEVSSVSAEK